MLREEISWHLHSQAFRDPSSDVSEYIAPDSPVRQEATLFPMVGFGR